MKTKYMVLSIDLDSWCHCRWASGSSNSLWPDSKSALRECLGSDHIGIDFLNATDWILKTLGQSDIKATFFILAEVAQMVPECIKKISEDGHETALHGLNHVDNSLYSLKEFREMIKKSKQIVEDISGSRILGYRAPNLVMDAAHVNILEQEDFLYDSSVCPSRKFFGKYSNMSGAPSTPYIPSREDIAIVGNRNLVELPIPVFPFIRIPAASGIMTRVIGGWWTQLGLEGVLRKGYGMYYFHPYEVGEKISVPNSSLYVKLFCRNIGDYLKNFLSGYLLSLKQRVSFVTGVDLARLVLKGEATFD